jgi:hypothetical protein
VDGTGYSGHLTRTDFGPYPPCSPEVKLPRAAPNDVHQTVSVRGMRAQGAPLSATLELSTQMRFRNPGDHRTLEFPNH